MAHKKPGHLTGLSEFFKRYDRLADQTAGDSFIIFSMKGSSPPLPLIVVLVLIPLPSVGWSRMVHSKPELSTTCMYERYFRWVLSA